MTARLPAWRSLAFTALLLAVPQHAFAQDNTAVAERFKQLMAEQSGMTVTWTGLTGDSAKMVLQGVTVQPTGAAQGAPIGDLTFEGISQDGDAFKVEKVSTGSYNFTEDDATIDISPAIFTNVVMPPAGGDVLASMMLYDSATLDSASVTVKGAKVFSMEKAAFNLSSEEGKPKDFDFSIDKFTADFTTAPDPQAQAVLGALGYTVMTGSMEMEGSWDLDAGDFELSQYDITVDNAGTLGVTAEIGGYTAEFMKSVRDLQKKMAEQERTPMLAAAPAARAN